MFSVSNKTLFNIHGWLGLNLGLLLFVICISGTVATLSNEIDWLLNRDMRMVKQDKPVQWQKMYENLRVSYPEASLSGIYKNTYAGNEDYFATAAYMAFPNGQTRKIYLDPYTGKIKGDTSFFNVQRFFRSYHRRFFDGDRGIFIITLSSFFLLLSALTGFLFYKGWLKNLFQLRLKRGIKKLFSDAHKLTGVWSLVFTLLMAITGIFYFVELMFQAADNYDVLLPDEPQKIEQAELREFGPNPSLLSLDKYVKNAKQAFPGLKVSTVRIPDQPDNYVYVDGQAGNPLLRKRANKVYLHPFTAEVIHIQQSSDLNAAEFITDMADPLHFGYLGGLATKIIWFIFGLGISFAILSGTFLWYIRKMDKMDRRIDRFTNNKQGRHKKSQITISGFYSTYFTFAKGAVISTAVVIIYLTTTAISTVSDGIKSYGPLPEDRISTVEELDMGPWEIDLQCEYPCKFEKGTRIVARFKNSEIPNYKSASIDIIGNESQSDDLNMHFSGSAKKPSLILSEVDIINGKLKDTGVNFSVTTQTENVYSRRIDLAKFRAAGVKMENRFSAFPERSYPEVPFLTQIFLGGFALLVFLVISGWSFFLVKSILKREKIPSNS